MFVVILHALFTISPTMHLQCVVHICMSPTDNKRTTRMSRCKSSSPFKRIEFVEIVPSCSTRSPFRWTTNHWEISPMCLSDTRLQFPRMRHYEMPDFNDACMQSRISVNVTNEEKPSLRVLEKRSASHEIRTPDREGFRSIDIIGITCSEI